MEQVVLREATREDVAALQALAVRTYLDTFAGTATDEDNRLLMEKIYSRAQLLRDADEPGARLVLACVGDRPVGFLRLRENAEVNTWLGSSHLELHRLYLDSSFHGTGLANRVMQVAYTETQQRQRTWLWLGVWERNYRAQRFYERHGFERFGEHTFWVGHDPQIDWLMRKKIT